MPVRKLHCPRRPTDCSPPDAAVSADEQLLQDTVDPAFKRLVAPEKHPLIAARLRDLASCGVAEREPGRDSVRPFLEQHVCLRAPGGQPHLAVGEVHRDEGALLCLYPGLQLREMAAVEQRLVRGNVADKRQQALISIAPAQPLSHQGNELSLPGVNPHSLLELPLRQAADCPARTCHRHFQVHAHHGSNVDIPRHYVSSVSGRKPMRMRVIRTGCSG